MNSSTHHADGQDDLFTSTPPAGSIRMAGTLPRRLLALPRPPSGAAPGGGDLDLHPRCAGGPRPWRCSPPADRRQTLAASGAPSPPRAGPGTRPPSPPESSDSFSLTWRPPVLSVWPSTTRLVWSYFSGSRRTAAGPSGPRRQIRPPVSNRMGESNSTVSWSLCARCGPIPLPPQLGLLLVHVRPTGPRRSPTAAPAPAPIRAPFLPPAAAPTPAPTTAPPTRRRRRPSSAGCYTRAPRADQKDSKRHHHAPHHFFTLHPGRAGKAPATSSTSWVGRSPTTTDHPGGGVCVQKTPVTAGT